MTELVTAGPLTVRLTVLLPAAPYVCVRILAVVLVVDPSPKFQERFKIVPVEVSVNVTTSGHEPLVGVAEKLATGATVGAELITPLIQPMFADTRVL